MKGTIIVIGQNLSALSQISLYLYFLSAVLLNFFYLAVHCNYNNAVQ